MNEIYVLFILLICGTASAVTAAAGEAAVSGRVVITKVMTKKRVTLPSYDLRGVAVSSGNPDKPTGGNPGADELSRVVIYLEGPGLKPAAPIRSTMAQKNRHFEPD